MNWIWFVTGVVVGAIIGSLSFIVLGARQLYKEGKIKVDK